MTSSKSIWVFFNSANHGQKIEVVGSHSAMEFVKLLRQEELSTWHVQEAGKALPCAVKDSSLCKDHDRGASVISFQKDSEQVTHIAKNAQDKRSLRRVETSYRVIIKCGKETFATYSINISSGGLLLEEKAPENFISKECKITIETGDNLCNLEFVGRVISASDQGTRVRFEENENTSDAKALVTFLESVERKKKKIHFNTGSG